MSYSVGQPHDVVTVADWDCDGSATPGLVRPSTGEVFLFDRWAADGQPLTESPATVVPGAVALAPPDDGPGCDPSVLTADDRAVPLVSGADGWTVAEGDR